MRQEAGGRRREGFGAGPAGVAPANDATWLPRASWQFGVLLMTSTWVGVAAAQFESGIPVGTRAPMIVVHDLDGKSVDLGTYLGKKPVLFQFWASWCPVCKGLLPKLEAVEREFGNRVVKIGINITVNDSKQKARRYLARHRPPFLALYDDQGVSARAYDVPTTGFIVIVDGRGKVAYTGVGEDQDLVAAVRKVVGK